ncbi:ankyrin repeat protein, putative [Bodo saltans]|uniref:Ankyrin repeat protein, putative n=1 Tax=Bodo saltans TaxID=75058 RepID=B6DTG8_BODSA|nr:hypothetical protein [Bodo saltans]CUG90305.1 ankyrin repeat protein, putative [Bodo saltans]|eukprot:CUG90305.1 ankyrin repeat protein, putative [Bodo saltans]
MADFPKLPRIKQDDENMEKLHCAARKGQTELVRRLIGMGISPSIQNRFGCTALHLACKFGQVSCARELVGVSDTNIAWHGQKPLHLAVLSGNLQLVKALCEGAKEQGRGVEAMLNECDEMEVTEIGEHRKVVQGQTALHWCVGLGPEAKEMMTLLLSFGASPNAKDKGGETPLMRALEFGNQDAQKILITKKEALRLDTGDKNGQTALVWAIRYGNEAFAQTLIELGADVNVEDQQKQTVLLWCVRAGMSKLLDIIVDLLDPFVVQSAPFHNGTSVLVERIDWLPTTEEAHRQETVKTFQKRLDLIAKAPKGGNALNRTQNGQGSPMMLAPSAPLRKN